MSDLHVFVVEDNPLIRANLMSALKDLVDARILAFAESEPQAIDWLSQHKGGWDLAIVDLFLKKGNGVGIVRWTCGRLKHQKVAVLTNYATPAVREECLREGADAVFDKSTELDQFFDFCRRLDSTG